MISVLTIVIRQTGASPSPSVLDANDRQKLSAIKLSCVKHFTTITDSSLLCILLVIMLWAKFSYQYAWNYIIILVYIPLVLWFSV